MDVRQLYAYRKLGKVSARESEQQLICRRLNWSEIAYVDCVCVWGENCVGLVGCLLLSHYVMGALAGQLRAAGWGETISGTEA